jgi:tetratricopeptide (TPR) repeat protein
MSPALLALTKPPEVSTLLLLFLAFLVVERVTNFLHELGHALLGHWNGFVTTSFGVGTRRLFAVWDWGGTRVYLGLGGKQALTCTVIPQIYPSRRQLLALYSGGLWAHALLILVGVALWRNLSWGGPLWALLVALNVLLLVINLLPFEVRFGGTRFRSDGLVLLETLRSGMPRPDLTRQINTLRALRPLLAAVGDARGQYHLLVSGALAWVSLGNPARARQLLAEAVALPLTPTPFDLAYLALARGRAARAAGELTAAAAALDEAARRFAEMGHAAGQFVTAWARANLLACQGDVTEALTQLEALASHPIAVARGPVRAALLADRLCALARLSEAAGLENLLKEYEAERKAYPSTARDLDVYQAVAASLQQAGRVEAARRTWGQAREAALQVDRGFGHEEDRAYFRQGQEDLAQLASASASPLAERVPSPDTLWPTAEDLRQEEADLQARRSRLLLGIGWLVLAVNLALGATSVAHLLSGPPLQHWDDDSRDELARRLAVPVCLGVGATLAVLISAGWLLLAWFNPSLRRKAGAVTCYASLLPYVLLLGYWLAGVPWSP